MLVTGSCLNLEDGRKRCSDEEAIVILGEYTWQCWTPLVSPSSSLYMIIPMSASSKFSCDGPLSPSLLGGSSGEIISIRGITFALALS